MAWEYFKHVTKNGDRWDLIAHKYYGDATLIEPLLKANPAIVAQSPAPLVFGNGVPIDVPVLREEEIAASQLPPWKRP